MKLTCNDHPPLRHLDEGRVDVDFLKITSLEKLETEVGDALTYRPALVHVGFGITDSVASYANLDWAWFNRMVRRSGSPHVALHLGVSTRNWPNGADLRYQSGSEARDGLSSERVMPFFAGRPVLSAITGEHGLHGHGADARVRGLSHV